MTLNGNLWNAILSMDTYNRGYGAGIDTPEQQAIIAFNFYNAVANTPDPHTANISLTGHSLGGGLAGVAGGE